MRLARRRPAVVPAPVWRRIGAALIDLWPLALGPIALAAGLLSAGAALKVRRWWGGEEKDAFWDGDDEGADDDDEADAVAEQTASRSSHTASPMTDGQRRWMALFSSWQWRVASLTWSAVAAVRVRNRRTRGARAMGIRRADVRTGGPVSVRSGLIAFAVRAAWREFARRVVSGPQLDAKARTEIRAPDRGSEEYSERVRRSRLRAFAEQLAIAYAPSLSILWTARRQSLPDWLAGIVVVSDDS